MSLDLDPGMMAATLLLVACLALLLGLALDGLMDRGGFGPLGNMAIITGGFFLGFLIANHFGIISGDLAMASATGLAGAFLTLAVSALIKAWYWRGRESVRRRPFS